MDSIIIDTGTSIINLNGQTYKICYYGSLNAICEISEIFIKDISAREKTIYLIHALLCGDKEKKPSVSELNTISNNDIINTLDLIITHDEKLKTFANDYMLSKSFEDFCTAYENYLLDMTENVTQVLSGALSRMSDLMADIRDSILNMWKHYDFSRVFENITLSFKHLTDSLISNSIISEEELQQKIKSIETWANYGWTFLEWAPFSYTDFIPNNQLEADKYAISFIPDKELQAYFDELYIYNIDKSEIKEAISCFEHKEYRGCSMILISLIERRLLILQRKQSHGKKINVGAGACNKFANTVLQDLKDDSFVYKYLLAYSLELYLNTLFSKTDNFKSKTAYLNRNYLLHGMLKKRVTKKDCLKLFLTLGNIFHAIEFSKYDF